MSEKRPSFIDPVKEPPKEQVKPAKEEVKVHDVIPETTRPITIMTEGDAYISERMKQQPKTLEDIQLTTREENLGIHRLSLPDFFESFSYDCTMGQTCSHHGWVKTKVSYGLDKTMDRWEQTKRGKYIFRWLSKNKRALDLSLNVKDWLLVNRNFFPDAPKILFSVNGGVENGDSILGFMPVAKALSLREKPSRDSQDRVNSEARKHEDHPNFYKAKLDPEKKDGDDYAPAEALQEGRDF
jgi:hypothetical protein